MRNLAAFIRPLALRAAGLLWLASWMAVLFLVHEPWRHLGGLVDETVRYWERVAVAAAAVVGCFAGVSARDAARPGMGRSHAGLLIYLLALPAAAVAAVLISLRGAGAEDWIGVAFNGLLGYWAGLDTGIGAWPLFRGRHYSFRGPIMPEPSAGDEGSDLDADPRFR